ncbi:hypothetical protein [Acetobacter fallax]|uniref:Uncharacterized protein n=1 Tax=Acetobacter fallax TaxID=1737473 RepID=A0ABX0KG24_9PROT|nr:hypothetical protein [Acetobacter fallax]NHO33375.1 hypothetical protein [Acetobacter fallax]NHO36994.1 hypothetical protein [Acetobacter fallax]
MTEPPWIHPAEGVGAKIHYVVGALGKLIREAAKAELGASETKPGGDRWPLHPG